MVELLLAHGADPNARDANGVSAADAASRMGAPDTAALLAKKAGA
jgi:ankyrin repeat protein